ncbi:MAG: ABC transporter transmembrane domain-containing protein [Acidimicrobiia bacterium]|nr:ABC transporter transmembrane domain-containing protein [Acidimicrobiia bacterium]MDX2468887.1 ABC transporter transmembrane domain-containing protein [Acidimicrobiia bacterium]
MQPMRRRRPRATAEKTERLGRDQLSQVRRLFVFARPYRSRIIAATVAVAFGSGLGLVFPRVMGDLVDSALSEVSSADTSELDRFAIILVIVFLAQAGFNFLRSYWLAIAGEGVVADLRRAVFDRVVRLAVPFFDERKTGEITSRLTADAAVVQTTVSTAVAQALAQGITLVGSIILLFLLNFRLSLTVLTFVPVIMIAAAIFGRRLRRVSTDFQDKLAAANSLAEEAISSIRVVKWFTAEGETARLYDHDIRASYEVAVRRARLRSIFVPTVTFVMFSTLALVLWQGGRQVISGELTAGNLVTFLLYTLTVAGAIGTFTGLYAQLQEALGASKRIFELLDETPEIANAASTTNPEPIGTITFDNVSFSYAERTGEVLTGINLDVHPGELVALVGPSGAGKTTLVQLIPRFYDVTSGQVLVDGVDVRDQDIEQLRQRMAAVPQEVELFSGTIAENLRVAKANASDSELVDACTAANAHDFISQFPDGYGTVVGERGIKLSGGQRQRVAIARALLADPSLLILDEATSSLDAESEGLVQAALEVLMQGRTTVVIAHRLSTVRKADRLVVLAEGHIIEEGTHDELVDQGGLYSELYGRQLEA